MRTTRSELPFTIPVASLAGAALVAGLLPWPVPVRAHGQQAGPEPAGTAVATLLEDDEASPREHASEGADDIALLRRRMRETGPSPLLLERLGWAFVARARASGDHDDYARAERCARAIRETAPKEADSADLLGGHALHALHRFAEAEHLAAHLVERRGEALDWTLYGDVLLDEGRIDEAVVAYEHVMEQRPDSRAFARVAEVRLLTGDLDGARDAMSTAARAVSLRDRESFAWIWSRLAILELQSGNLARARTIAGTATAAAPGSSTAQAALGRIFLAAGDSARAVAPLERAAAHAPLVDTMRALADAYAASGREDAAKRVLAELQANGTRHDPRGFSVWLSESGTQPQRALRIAEAELALRRDVFTYDALAIASSAAGRIEDARRYIERALAAGTRDARLWYHAGVIAAAANERAEAREWFERARTANLTLLPSVRCDLERRLSVLDERGPEHATGPGCRGPLTDKEHTS